jgi:replicative DNA helicase
MSGSAGFSATRQPPMNVVAEMSLLGALLHNNHAIERCGDLKPEHFAGEDLGAVFEAIVDGIGAGHVVDAVSLDGRFPRPLLASLLAAMVGIINVADYARVIRETSAARRMIEIGETLVNAAFSGGSPAEIGALAARQLDGLTMGTRPGNQSPLDAAMDAALASMERARTGQTAGISTGFPSLDRRLGGLEPGLVYVVAGRPGMGKSAIGHQIAINAARAGVSVLELSLEMSATQLGRRTLASAAGVPINLMKSGQIGLDYAERLVKARKELAGLPLTIDDTAGQSPQEIAIKARAAKRSGKGLGLVMIDHLNLMRAEAEDARHGGTWATERASATCLQIAKDCGVPVLLLAQLNRGVEAREDKRPGLADLRQAGAIEQDAYAVGFVYREEYYNRAEPVINIGERIDHFNQRHLEWLDYRERIQHQAEMIWAKVRDGDPGTDKLRFDAPTATFMEDRG